MRQLTRLCVRYAERYIPNPYLYAVLLTFITVAAALLWTPSAPGRVIEAWYKGIWDILAFATQMALILLTGVTLGDTVPVRRGLSWLAGIPRQQGGAAATVFLASAVASWLNWAFGMVVGALLAREIAKRLKEVDFSFLVAAAYMGFMVWASGLSSSIALASATPGSALNIIEQVTGRTAGLNETIFTAFNLVPVVVLMLVIPLALRFMGPQGKDMKRVDPKVLAAQEQVPATPAVAATPAMRLENAWVISLLLVALGLWYEVHAIGTHGFHLDINGFIFLALLLGLLLHWRPIDYVRSFEASARTVGPILLQFPLYGGIMGIMTGTGLAALIAERFVGFSSAHTLAFWSFVASNIISLFIPSGGGHWAVQGPFMVPAAVKLGVSPALVAMATAMGEQTANMVQPFWALPILAIARLGIRDIMGYCAIALLIGLAVFGGALLVFS